MAYASAQWIKKWIKSINWFQKLTEMALKFYVCTSIYDRSLNSCNCLLGSRYDFFQQLTVAAGTYKLMYSQFLFNQRIMCADMEQLQEMCTTWA